MLQNLNISNFVLIEKADIPFSNGFCVLTGETGAGKSILLNALGLIMGKRAESKLVRNGSDKAQISAIFDISHNKNTKDILCEADFEIEDELIIRRVISADGKSKAFINDSPTSINFLQNISDSLVEIHGQHDQRGLLDDSTHRTVLDDFGNYDDLKNEVKSSYKNWQAAEKQYKHLLEQSEIAKRDQEYLEHSLEDLNSLSPVAGEEHTLSEQRNDAMKHEKVLEAIAEARNEISNKRFDAVSAISSSEKILTRSTTSEKFTDILESLDKASIELSEAIGEMDNFVKNIELDYTNIDQIEERLFALRGAARKYQCSVDELPTYHQKIAEKIALINSSTANLKTQDENRQEARKKYISAAKKLCKNRQEAAKKLEFLIIKELKPLKMDNARFQVKVEELSETKWSGEGTESICFMVATNKGDGFDQLNKIASGGEISRFMLALKVVLSSKKSTPTMIFDEIDTGIGGAVADSVGSRLSKLASNVQVVCVTHQPQVASYANHHIFIEKNDDTTSTKTNISILNDKHRKEEIARMLSGADISDEARNAADKLLGSAA